MDAVSGRRRANAARFYLKGELTRIVAARRASGAQSADLASLLIEARDPDTGRGMDDREIVDNLLTFISAGHETTALALAWTFYLLSLHPDVEAKTLDEIAAVSGGGEIEAGHLGRLAYTRQVLLEAMRLYPPAPILARAAVEEVRIGGEKIARGAPTYVPIYAVHRHLKLWPDADRFDPARFAPEAVAARPRFAYLPFGGGPRICIGMHFALTEALAILAILLPAVRLATPVGRRPDLQMRITLRPRHGLPMIVSRRR